LQEDWKLDAIKEDEGLLITTDLPLNSQQRWARDTTFYLECAGYEG
jgi:hypothetical protein